MYRPEHFIADGARKDIIVNPDAAIEPRHIANMRERMRLWDFKSDDMIEEALTLNGDIKHVEMRSKLERDENYEPPDMKVLNGRGPTTLFPFIYAADIDVQEQVDFRIDAWIEEKGINVLYAPKDHYKSFLAVDWFMCVASGKPWCGFETKQGAGVYIAGEGNSGLKRRIKAWCIKNKADLQEMDIALSKFPMQVLDLNSIKEWAEHIEKVQEHLGKPIEFVVIDTLATNFGPGDENSSTDMARFIAHLKIYIQAVFDCTIIIVHHTGKDAEKGARGGYAIEANADAVYELKRQKDSTDDAVQLRCKHIKDSEPPPDLTLSKEVVELGFNDRNGHPVTSLVLKMSLCELEQAILNQSHAGKGQRMIAQNVGKSKTTVVRIQARLRKLGLLKTDEK